jgi:hypothetical protein
MSSIIRIADIGRPGQLVYTPNLTSVLDQLYDSYVMRFKVYVNHQSTTSTSYVKTAYGSFTIPSTVWTSPVTSIYHYFQIDFQMQTGGGTGYAYVVIDGQSTSEFTTTSTSWVSKRTRIIKYPSGTTINWELWMKNSTSNYKCEIQNLYIKYTPIWPSNTIQSIQLGINTLLTRAVIPPSGGIIIDDEYSYHNSTSSTIELKFDNLPFNKLDFSPIMWTIVEYVRVE